MKARWNPLLTDRPVVYSQPEPDVLRARGWRHDGTAWVEYEGEYDFSDPAIIEYEVSNLPYINSARRVDGVLCLELCRPYHAGDSLWWDTGEYIDYGTQADLMACPREVGDGAD